MAGTRDPLTVDEPIDGVLQSTARCPARRFGQYPGWVSR